MQSRNVSYHHHWYQKRVLTQSEFERLASEVSELFKHLPGVIKHNHSWDTLFKDPIWTLRSYMWVQKNSPGAIPGFSDGIVDYVTGTLSFKTSVKNEDLTAFTFSNFIGHYYHRSNALPYDALVVGTFIILKSILKDDFVLTKTSATDAHIERVKDWIEHVVPVKGLKEINLK